MVIIGNSNVHYLANRLVQPKEILYKYVGILTITNTKRDAATLVTWEYLVEGLFKTVQQVRNRRRDVLCLKRYFK